MTFEEVYKKITDANNKSENRAKNLAEIFDEEFPDFDDSEFKKDIINSILAETLHKNDPIAQEALKRIKNKYK